MILTDVRLNLLEYGILPNCLKVRLETRIPVLFCRKLPKAPKSSRMRTVGTKPNHIWLYLWVWHSLHCFWMIHCICWQASISVSKESACNAEDPASIPGSGRSPGEGNGNPLQYSCLENPMDRGAWQATVYEITRVRHDLVTKPPPQLYILDKWNFYFSMIYSSKMIVRAVSKNEDSCKTERTSFL